MIAGLKLAGVFDAEEPVVIGTIAPPALQSFVALPGLVAPTLPLRSGGDRPTYFSLDPVRGAFYTMPQVKHPGGPSVGDELRISIGNTCVETTLTADDRSETRSTERLLALRRGVYRMPSASRLLSRIWTPGSHAGRYAVYAAPASALPNERRPAGATWVVYSVGAYREDSRATQLTLTSESRCSSENELAALVALHVAVLQRIQTIDAGEYRRQTEDLSQTLEQLSKNGVDPSAPDGGSSVPDRIKPGPIEPIPFGDPRTDGQA